MGWGIDQRIDAYGIIGWNAEEIPYRSEELEQTRVLQAPPGSGAHSAAWRQFLPEFRAYLGEQGWFERTHLAFDERSDEPESLIELIRGDAAGWKIALSYVDAYLPETLRRGLDVASLSVVGAHLAAPASGEGQIRTLYTSCHYDPQVPVSRVNSLITLDSSPADVEWLTWYVDKLGMDGYARWAYDYWRTVNPFDMRSGFAHTSGDGSLIYRTSNDRDVQAMTSIRLEMLRQGIQAFEKRRVLRALYIDHEYESELGALDALLGDDYILAARAADGFAQGDLTRVRERLDNLSIEASSLVQADTRCD